MDILGAVSSGLNVYKPVLIRDINIIHPEHFPPTNWECTTQVPFTVFELLNLGNELIASYLIGRYTVKPLHRPNTITTLVRALPDESHSRSRSVTVRSSQN